MTRLQEGDVKVITQQGMPKSGMSALQSGSLGLEMARRAYPALHVAPQPIDPSQNSSCWFRYIFAVSGKEIMAIAEQASSRSPSQVGAPLDWIKGNWGLLLAAAVLLPTPQFVVSFGFIPPVNSHQGVVAYGIGTFFARDFVRMDIAITVLAYLLTLLFGATCWRWLGYV